MLQAAQAKAPILQPAFFSGGCLHAFAVLGFVSSNADAAEEATLQKETKRPNGRFVIVGERRLALELRKEARQLVVWMSDDPEEVRLPRPSSCYGVNWPTWLPCYSFVL